MKIAEVKQKDFADWVMLGKEFWPRHSEADIKKDFKRMLGSKKEQSFLCRNERGYAIGFINLAIRTDYVEGSKTSPVGYLEGIYVKKAYRNQGVAKMLFGAAQKWFVKKKVSEIGSDAMASNKVSQKFHKSLGFKKGETLVHFIKKI